MALTHDALKTDEPRTPFKVRPPTPICSIMPLHLSKVAVGCASIATLGERQSARLSGGVVPIVTRYRPKREAELAGGSLFWIIRHSLVVRQAIVGFDEAMTEKGLRCLILVEPRLIEVMPRALRAHQGWRYLAGADAPRDLGEGMAGSDLPDDLLRELTGLALL